MQVRVESQIIVGRRALLAGALAATASSCAMEAVASDVVDLHERVERSARSLAEALQALHGGAWSIQISHASGFVAISRDFA